MSVFSDAELTYLAKGSSAGSRQSTELGMPHVVPLGWRYNPGAGRDRHRRPGLRPDPEVPQCAAQPERRLGHR